MIGKHISDYFKSNYKTNFPIMTQNTYRGIFSKKIDHFLHSATLCNYYPAHNLTLGQEHPAPRFKRYPAFRFGQMQFSSNIPLLCVITNLSRSAYQVRNIRYRLLYDKQAPPNFFLNTFQTILRSRKQRPARAAYQIANARSKKLGLPCGREAPKFLNFKFKIY